MAYAENTTVTVAKSRIEIEELIRKHGAADHKRLTRKDGGKDEYIYPHIRSGF